VSGPRARVSVILPTYNRRSVLGGAIRSALRRIGGRDEIVVVDDGSTDGSAEAVRAIPGPIRLLRTERRGPAAARNAGIEAAAGEYLAFLDSDDEWLPAGLDEQVAALADGGAGLSHAAARNVDLNGDPVERRPRRALAGDVLPELLRRNFVTTSTAVVPRAVLEAAGGFDEALGRSMDWDLWIRIAERHRFHYFPATVARYRFHDGQQIRDREEVDDCRRRILEKTLARYRKDRPELVPRVRRLLAYRLLRLGRLRLRKGDREGARASFRAAAAHRPLARLTAARYGLLVRANGTR